MCAFVTEHRARFRVAQICRVLPEHGAPISPRTFYARLARPVSKRALWDTTITEVLAGYYDDKDGKRRPESLYGAVKMWAHLQRDGIPVARCTVERLMRANGWHGVTRREKVRTTIADPSAPRTVDLVERQFREAAPNVLVVADFTYVAPASGVFVYVAFVIDAFAGRIVGWECAATKTDWFVRTAICHAAQLRNREDNTMSGSTIHHSDAGSQYTSVRWGETPGAFGADPIDRYGW